MGNQGSALRQSSKGGLWSLALININYLVEWLIYWLISWFIHSFINISIDLLIDWLIDKLIDWFINWFIDWPWWCLLRSWTWRGSSRPAHSRPVDGNQSCLKVQDFTNDIYSTVNTQSTFYMKSAVLAGIFMYILLNT